MSTKEERIDKLKELGWKKETVTIDRWHTPHGFVASSEWVETVSDDEFEKFIEDVIKCETSLS